MASASPFRSESAVRTRQRTVGSLRRVLRPYAEFLGFWAAVILPFALLALVASGIATQYPTVAAALVVGNLAGLRLGRSYKR
jgi:hypothetical protein